ncbi:hypothetical protein ENBRE01_0025 [Enteropsectra breve]|nr:hypothetical protein ENBRE01_0025 [Enteropsectra breve]
MLNNWEQRKIIHRNDIFEFKLLHEKGFIKELCDDLFCLTVPQSTVEEVIYGVLISQKAKQMAIDDVDKEIQALIKKINQYNGIKDIADELIGILAENKGITIKQMHTDLGLELEY